MLEATSLPLPLHCVPVVASVVAILPRISYSSGLALRAQQNFDEATTKSSKPGKRKQDYNTDVCHKDAIRLQMLCLAMPS